MQNTNIIYNVLLILYSRHIFVHVELCTDSLSNSSALVIKQDLSKFYSHILANISVPAVRNSPNCLEAFPVDDGWSRFIIFLFRDPHLLEGGQGGQDGTTDPDGVFPLWWGDNFDFHGWWSKGCDFLLHTISDTREHGAATRKNVVGVQVFPDVNVAPHN